MRLWGRRPLPDELRWLLSQMTPGERFWVKLWLAVSRRRR